MADDSPELRELRKQTAMMAPRHIANGAVGMGFLAFVLMVAASFAVPSIYELPAWVFWAYFIGAMALGGWIAGQDAK